MAENEPGGRRFRRWPKHFGSEGRRRVRRRLRGGTYLLPSLFTTGNVLLGFYAVVLGFRGRLEAAAGNEPAAAVLFENAAVAIILAGVLDALDGRIARLTGTESEFGKEYDSLADVLTFGAAPALLAFFWGLSELGRPGWLIPLFYLLCTAIRLARFNVQTRTTDSRYFVGLPSPAAAGAIVALLFSTPVPATWQEQLEWLRPEVVVAVMVVALITVGSLMVSTFRFPSFKKLDLRERWSYRRFVAVAAGVLVLAYRPPAFLLSAALLYTLSGPVTWLWGRLRRRGDTGAAADSSADSSADTSISENPETE